MISRLPVKTTYRCLSFAEISVTELYQLLQLRQQVFVVEQNCPYLDADGLDEHAYHLLGYQTIRGKEQLVACLRIISPGKKNTGPAIGRLATAQAVRGQGIGREILVKALHSTSNYYPGQVITISAQLYLKRFYTSLGFIAVSEPYDEDSILHIDMIYQH